MNNNLQKTEKRLNSLRKGVSALIMNKNQQLLLVNLKSFEEKFYAVPGGGTEEGETLENAAYREIKEELDISRKSLNFVGSCKDPIRLLFKTKKLIRNGIEYNGMERYFFGFIFVGNDDEIVLQSEEIRSYKWVEFTDLKYYLLFDNQLEETTKKIIELFPALKQDTITPHE